MSNNRLFPALLALFAALLPAACSDGRAAAESDGTICVSIPPLKSLVTAIVEDDFPIVVLVPPGASPETFEPTPKQLVAVRRAQWLFQIGLIDFETVLVKKIADPERVVDLARSPGVELIEGSCSHAGHAAEAAEAAEKTEASETVESANAAESTGGRDDHDHAHGRGNGHTGHVHGIDPHLWSSPRMLQRMAATIYGTIHAAYPDSLRYTRNHERLQAALAALDRRTADRIAASGVRTIFIYHPALTYYARDYGLRQIAIEAEGKEPSARHLARLIRQALEEGIRRILYQQQFPKSSVEAIAADIGAETAPFDPLAEDAIANIDAITELVTRP